MKRAGGALLLALGACSVPPADLGEARINAAATTIPAAVVVPRVMGHDTGDAWFLDASSVESARLLLADPGIPRRFPARLYLARSLLATGAAGEAVDILRELLTDIDAGLEPAPSWFRLRVLRELATAWMVIGEQDNCILHHGSDSCLAPISEAGRHVAPRGSREAMAVLERLLGEVPDDLEARWLFNIAAMTVGRWPDGVPAAWRIPSAAFESEGESRRFREVAPGWGLADRQLAGGLSVEDFDGDGRFDVLTSEAAEDRPLLLYRNTGGRFIDRTTESGLSGVTGGRVLRHADIDNDGDLDVLVVRGLGRPSAPQQWPLALLLNDGGRFRDGAAEAGLIDTFSGTTAAFADYDLDGWLDLFVGNAATREERRRPSRFYRGRGDGGFVHDTSATPAPIVSAVSGCAWGDFDDDGDPDLVVARLDGPPLLLRNDRGRFVDVARTSGIDGPPTGSACIWFDADDDGDLDLFIGGWSSGATAAVCADYLGLPAAVSTPRLFLNRGGGQFEDGTAEAGLLRAMPVQSANVGDFDNDGQLDLMLGTGEPDLCALYPDRLFRGVGGGRFLDVTTAAGVGHLQKGGAVVFADLDDDGDLDILAQKGGLLAADAFHRACFENPGGPGQRVTLRLEGVTANRSAIGARLRLRVVRDDGSRRDIHRLIGGDSGHGTQPLRADIGLGDAIAIESIEIAWPAGASQIVSGVELGEAWTIREGEASVRIDVAVGIARDASPLMK